MITIPPKNTTLFGVERLVNYVRLSVIVAGLSICF